MDESFWSKYYVPTYLVEQLKKTFMKYIIQFSDKDM